MNSPTIYTEDLILRKFETGDIQAVYDIFSDEQVNTFLPWFPLRSIQQAKQMLEEQYLPCYRQPYGYRYAICLQTDNVPIGYLNISMNDSYDFGYGMRKEFWHKGIMIQAAKAVVKQLKQDKIPYITATHDVNNPKSGKVMQRLGMKYQYSYREQWQPKNISVVFRMYQLNLSNPNSPVYRKYWNQSSDRFVETNLDENTSF